MATVNSSELLKEASRIRPFNGSDGYDPSSFIREVDAILRLFNDNPSLKEFVIQRYVLTKVNGDALKVVRPLGSTPMWDDVKEELIRNFGVKESYRSLYHQAINVKHYNINWTLIFLILMTMAPTATSILTIQPIHENSGYVEISTSKTEIVVSSEFIIHAIDPYEILYLINNMTFNTNLLRPLHRDLLRNELLILKTKVKTLIPKSSGNRHKGGLFNLVGTMNKYLFMT
ncbi:uncharacterized protein LOC125777380 [Bactrocera dorsalis]|uniref:Uncharacterized protein LOC125777380 n=1 Tax=Bactrocera dorsalis TaxID=27457 RepID=A0ABM3JFU4_BACDO|nr:uncharacterized protein LOC125777380 [Bactrocera dorsalis]